MTDHPALLDDFLKRYPKNFYTSKGKFHEIYQPTYKNDGSKKMPKNVIVLISDGGAGLKGPNGETKGTWRDDFFTAIMGSNIKENGVPNAEKEVEIYERADMKGYYRIKDI